MKRDDEETYIRVLEARHPGLLDALGTDTDAAIAQRFGLCRSMPHKIRSRLGIPPFRHYRRNKPFLFAVGQKVTLKEHGPNVRSICMRLREDTTGEKFYMLDPHAMPVLAMESDLDPWVLS